LASAIEVRNRKINLLRKKGIQARVREGHELDDITAMLTGRNKVGLNQALSIDATSHALADTTKGGLVADLDKAGLRRVVLKRDHAFDLDVAREMWRMDDPTAGESTGNAHAQQVAAILVKHQENVRNMLNDAGASIGKTDHYVTRQSHDMWKIRGKGTDADYQAWRTAILPKLDPKTFDHLSGPGAVEGFMKKTWQALSSCVHDSATGSDWLSGFKGPGNLGKKISQERVLHFKDADSWSDYNHAYGHGAVIDSVAHGLEKGAKNAAVMRTLGTNPEAMFNGLIDDSISKAVARNDFKMADKLRQLKNGNLLDTVTGKAVVPGNMLVNQIGSFVRNAQSLAKLGGVVLSSLPDVAVAAGTLRANGVPLLDAYLHQFAAVAPDFLRAGGGVGRRQVASSLGVGIDGLMGGITSRFKAEHGPIGKMSKAVETFSKINGLTYWIDSMKTGVGLMLTHDLGRNAGKEFGDLHPRTQKSLQRYGMEKSEWDAIRQGAMKAADGKTHILPGELHNLSDEAVAGLGKQGESADQVREDLRTKLSTYVIDQTREATSEPTAGTRAFLQGSYQRLDGVHPVLAEAMKTFMQFKSFPLTHFSRSVMREVARDGLDVAGLAHLIVGTTLMGYVGMTAKQIAAGRDPRRIASIRDAANVTMAAMAQGGGAGLYGDFLFGQKNRFGDGALASELGPTFGTMEDAINLFQGLRDGTAKASDGLSLAVSNTPFLNLFYVKLAMDTLIIHRLQDVMNPGYTHRYVRNVKKQNDQTFWLSPTYNPYH
jgi:hypothetical protein